MKELKQDVRDYIGFYNNKRFHQSLNYEKPMSFYYESLRVNGKDYKNLDEKVAQIGWMKKE